MVPAQEPQLSIVQATALVKAELPTRKVVLPPQALCSSHLLQVQALVQTCLVDLLHICLQDFTHPDHPRLTLATM